MNNNFQIISNLFPILQIIYYHGHRDEYLATMSVQFALAVYVLQNKAAIAVPEVSQI